MGRSIKDTPRRNLSKSDWPDEEFYDYEETPITTTIMVHETPQKLFHDTGLVLPSGEFVVRFEPPKPTIGFIHDETWDAYDAGISYIATAEVAEDDDDGEENT